MSGHGHPQPETPRRQPERADGDGVEDLEGEARDHHLRSRLAELERASDQGRRRPGVLETRVPRAGCVLGRPEATVSAGEEEGGGHGPGIVTGRPRGGL